MQCIDPHMHLWDLNANCYPWLSDLSNGDSAAQLFNLAPLKRNYLIKDYLEDVAGHQIVKAVHVEAKFDESNPVGETRWLQSVADAPGSGGFPHGVVAHVNLGGHNAEALVAEHAGFANTRGIRHMLNRNPDIADRDYLLDDAWWTNFALLKKYNLLFDLQLYYPQMADAARLARRYPDTMMSLNHAGMPHHPGPEGFAEWKEGMLKLAECDNVVAKISGLSMTMADWSVDSIRPYVLETIAIFGVDRCMFASNFPVDGLHVNFGCLWDGFKQVVADLSENERVKLFHNNAERIYRL